MSRTAALGWLVAVGAASACVRPCPEGSARHGNDCLVSCNSSVECVRGEACQDGLCVPAADTGAVSSGGVAGSSSDSGNAGTSTPGTSSSGATHSSGVASSSFSTAGSGGSGGASSSPGTSSSVRSSSTAATPQASSLTGSSSSASPGSSRAPVDPVLLAVAPADVLQHSGAQAVQLTASDCVPGCVASWRGIDFPTTPGALADQWFITLTAAQVATAGTQDVLVRTPNGRTSNALPFTVRPSPAHARHAFTNCNNTQGATQLLLANPGGVVSHVSVRFLLPSGNPILHSVDAPAHGVTLVDTTLIAGLGSTLFGADVQSDQPLGVGSVNDYGTRAVGYAGVTLQGQHFYFPGAPLVSGQTYSVLLVNTGLSPVTVTMTTHKAGAPSTSTTAVAPSQRAGFSVTGAPDWVEVSAPADVAAQYSWQVTAAGMGGNGLVAPQLEWWIPGGQSTPDTLTRIMLANPGVAPAHVTLTYLGANGLSALDLHTVAAGGAALVTAPAPEERFLVHVVSDVPVSARGVLTRTAATSTVPLDGCDLAPVTPWRDLLLLGGARAADQLTTLVVGNPGPAPAQVSVVLHSQTVANAASRTLSVAAGQQVSLRSDDPTLMLPDGESFFAVLASDVPVVAQLSRAKISTNQLFCIPALTP